MREFLRASFVIPGAPGHWRRTRGSGPKRWTDDKTRAWEEAVAWHLTEVWRGAPIAKHCPASISLSFVWPWPSTKTLREILKARGLSQRPDRLLHTGTPDVDNAIKAILDGCNKSRQVWADDCQVAQLGRIQKWWSDEPRTEVALYEVVEEES